MSESTLALDRAMVEAALADRNAYARLLRRFEPEIDRYVRRLLGRRDEAAEDVLQEIFIKAYVNLNDYDRNRPLAPWLYRIAHNEAMSFLRKRRGEPPSISGEDALVFLAHLASDEDPHVSWQRRRTGDELRAALHGLDSRYRDVLVLRYLEEKSYDQVADILEMPPGTVATLIRRGLVRLRRALAKAPLDTLDANEADA